MNKKMHFIMGLLVAVLVLALALTGCAENANVNTNASTSENIDVNTNTQETEAEMSKSSLVGSVWRADELIENDGTVITIEDAISSGAEKPNTAYYLEFTDEDTCIALRLESNVAVMTEECNYSISDSGLNILHEKISKTSIDEGKITIIMSHGLGLIFTRTETLPDYEVSQDAPTSQDQLFRWSSLDLGRRGNPVSK